MLGWMGSWGGVVSGLGARGVRWIAGVIGEEEGREVERSSGVLSSGRAEWR